MKQRMYQEFYGSTEEAGSAPKHVALREKYVKKRMAMFKRANVDVSASDEAQLVAGLEQEDERRRIAYHASTLAAPNPQLVKRAMSRRKRA